MLLLVDNYDSFTFNLYDYFLKCGVAVEVVRNDCIDIDTIDEKYQGIVFSPGPGKPTNAGKMMDIIEKYYQKIPLFGVCLGMQAIGEFFGGQLIQANYPMHGKVSELTYDAKHSMFANITPPLKVGRYHSLVLDQLENVPLSIIATTDIHEPMAIVHDTLPIWGVQFHPESILTDQGIQIINNWLSCHLLN